MLIRIIRQPDGLQIEFNPLGLMMVGLALFMTAWFAWGVRDFAVTRLEVAGLFVVMLITHFGVAKVMQRVPSRWRLPAGFVFLAIVYVTTDLTLRYGLGPYTV